MISVKTKRSGSRMTRRIGWLAGAALLAAPMPLLANEPAGPNSVRALAAEQASGELASYYTHEAGALWIGADGTLDPAAAVLVQLIETADLAGLDPQAMGAPALR